MSAKVVRQIKALVEECTPEEQLGLLQHLKRRFLHPLEEEWGIDADIILSSIRRSSDLTKRGMRGIIAEAVFADRILGPLTKKGWKADEILDDRPYDFLIKNNERAVRIQVKLQRTEKRVPKVRRYGETEMYIVEIQKTRTGKNTTTKEDTRPYRFGEFDILAVNMHPSSRNWSKFFYTVGAWLLPRSQDEKLIQIMQPVPKEPTDTWTDNLETCIGWVFKREQKRIIVVSPTPAKQRRNMK